MKSKKVRTSKNNRKTYKKYGSVSFYKHPPNITTICGYNFLFLPVKCGTIEVKCKIFGGYYLENKENLGISHMLEHVLTEAWKKCKIPCSSYLEKYGTLSNASTSDMSTSFWINGLDKFTEILIEYILSIILDPYFTEKLLEREINAIHNELAILMNDPNHKLNRVISQTIFTNYGLQNGNNLTLQRKNLSKYTIKILKDFSNQLIASRKFLFIISGSINKRKIVNIIRQKLNNFNPVNRCLSLSSNKLLCYNIKKQVIYVNNPKKNTSEIRFYFLLNYYQGNHILLYVPIISHILGQGLNSLLVKELRVKQKLIYSTSVTYDTNFCGTMICVSISTVPKKLNIVLKKTVEIIKKYQKITIPSDTLTHYKLKSILFMQSVCLNNPASVSSFYTNQYFYQNDKKTPKIYTIKDIYNTVQKLDLQKVKKLLNIFFDLNKCSLFYMSHKKTSFSIEDF
jgi:predicted Zn-dependent peptidase